MTLGQFLGLCYSENQPVAIYKADMMSDRTNDSLIWSGLIDGILNDSDIYALYAHYRVDGFDITTIGDLAVHIDMKGV